MSKSYPHLPIDENSFIDVPGGTFFLGATEKEAQADLSERPIRRHEVADYSIARFPISIGQWMAFIEATSHSWPRDEWEEVARYVLPAERHTLSNYPITYVNWDDCCAYAEWRSLRDARNYRLPTSVEWEIACRGPHSAVPQGELTTAQLAFRHDLETDEGLIRLHRIGERPDRATGFGCEEMWCNIREWCLDELCSEESKPADPPKSPEHEKAVCGGNWWLAGYPRCSAHGSQYQNFRHETLGFRITRVP